MGSLNFKTARDFYILGLWLADGYWWSSSVGLSSTNEVLLDRFRYFLKDTFPALKIKERVYLPDGKSKRSLTAKHIYVNSRFLVKEFQGYKHKNRLEVPLKYLPAYFAGRIDGDGHVDLKHRTGIRIAYSSKEDAVRDLNLLKKFGQESPASLYRYAKANTWVLYFKKNFLRKVYLDIAQFAIKLEIFAP